MAFTLLNQKTSTTKENLIVGQLVYIPDWLLCKNPNSLKEVLVYIISIHDNNRTSVLKTLDGKLLSRHPQNIIDAKANKFEQKT